MSEAIADWSCEPIVVVSGYSGSGKTTLLEAAIPRLTSCGLRVAAIKHDAHGLKLDTEGKDSYRLFRAGADVMVSGPEESALRRHSSDQYNLDDTLALLLRDHDVVLVEGHKATPLPKVWLACDAEQSPPESVQGIHCSLGRDEERLSWFIEYVGERVDKVHSERTLYGGILVGGKSRRFGSPKQLLPIDSTPMVERIADSVRIHAEKLVLLGDGEVPESIRNLDRLIDAPETTGPLAGLLAGLRWSQRASWIVAACDLATISSDAVEWLLSQRRPGRWAVVPKVDEEWAEPLLAVYEPQALGLFESMARNGELRLQGVGHHPKVATPRVPEDLRESWLNVNSPDDLPTKLRRHST